MKYLTGLFLSVFLFFACYVHALAGRTLDAVMVYPNNGEPMVVEGFSMDYGSGFFKALWNEHAIEVPVDRIKTIKIIGVLDDQSDYDLKVEFTMLDGANPTMLIKDVECSGQTRFGEIKIQLREVASMDLVPDLSQPQATGSTSTQIPAPTPDRAPGDDASPKDESPSVTEP